MATPEEYYNDSSLWGNYQYVSLKEIVNNYIASRDTGDITAMSSFETILFHARNSIRSFSFSVSQRVKSVELELSPTYYIVMPPDYVGLVRASWVDDNGLLHPFAEDRRASIAKVYLQDNDYELLYDGDGEVLLGSDRKLEENTPTADDLDLRYFCEGTSFSPNVDASKSYPNGRYVINKDRGVIQFGSNLESKNIVLEYISDGLQEAGAEKVHKFALDAVYSYIYWKLILHMQREKVSLMEKQMAKKNYYNSRRLAKRKLNSGTAENWKKAMSGASKWIK